MANKIRSHAKSHHVNQHSNVNNVNNNQTNGMNHGTNAFNNTNNTNNTNNSNDTYNNSITNDGNRTNGNINPNEKLGSNNSIIGTNTYTGENGFTNLSSSNGSISMSHLRKCLHELITIASEYYNLDFSQTPLLKPLLLLTGSQSAGKSAIINYLYSMSLRRVGEQAVDEKFSVIECVSEKEFQELSGKNYNSNRTVNFKNQSDLHWLLKPRPENSVDDREGTVWYKLNSIQLMQRYKQFYENSELGEILRTHNLLEGVVVNERFVRSTELSPKQSPIVKDVILIDTPGFNDESIGSLAKFKAYIRLLEFFYEQSQYCFFVADPSRLRSIGNALHILELTIAENEVKQKVFETVGKEMMNPSRGKDSTSSNTPPSSGGVSFSLSNLVVDIAANALQRSIPFFTAKSLESNEQISTPLDYNHIGSSMYEKLYFIINKVDKIRNLYYAYFEFGLSLGRFFQHFPLPHANRILAVGLPMEQRALKYRYGFQTSGGPSEKIDEYKLYEKMFETMKWNGEVCNDIVVAQLHDLEAIICSLRGEDSQKRCLILYIDFVYKAINNIREADTNRFTKVFRKLKHYYNEPWSRAQSIYKEVLQGNDVSTN